MAEIRKRNQKALNKIALKGGIPLFCLFPFVFVGLIVACNDSTIAFGLIITYAALILMIPAGIFWSMLNKKNYAKVRDGFLEKIKSQGFNAVCVIDTGKKPLADPAVVALDPEKGLVALQSYLNPAEHFVFAATEVTNVWSGKYVKPELVYAACGFTVGGEKFVLPMRLKTTGCFLGFAYRFKTEIASYSRQRYNDKTVDFRFIEDVDKADAFAQLLLQMSRPEGGQ